MTSEVQEEQYYGYVLTWDDVSCDIWWRGVEFVTSVASVDIAHGMIDEWNNAK